jgi:hypothetical protein
MNLGETYVPNAEGAHLWVVITIPDGTGVVLIVNFTSHRPSCDESCVVEVGEHPFVKHKTVVAYEKARSCDPKVQAMFKSNASRRDPVSADLLKRIQEGALKSDLTVKKYQKLVAASVAKQDEIAKKA